MCDLVLTIFESVQYKCPKISLHLEFRFRCAILYGHKTIQESLLVIFVYDDDLQRPTLDFYCLLSLMYKTLFHHKFMTCLKAWDVISNVQFKRENNLMISCSNGWYIIRVDIL